MAGAYAWQVLPVAGETISSSFMCARRRVCGLMGCGFFTASIYRPPRARLAVLRWCRPWMDRFACGFLQAPQVDGCCACAARGLSVAEAVPHAPAAECGQWISYVWPSPYHAR